MPGSLVGLRCRRFSQVAVVFGEARIVVVGGDRAVRLQPSAPGVAQSWIGVR